LMKIERDFLAFVRIPGEARHVAFLGPTSSGSPHRRIAGVVIEKGVEAAARDDDFETRIEDGCENPIVTAERMANHSKAVALGERKSFQKIERAHIIPDRFHCPA